MNDPIDWSRMDDDADTDQWGPWKLDAARYVLYCPGYEVSLQSCGTSAGMLDWIVQVAEKGWATAGHTAGLVHALDDILRPQANLCSGWREGPGQTLSGEKIRELTRQYADALARWR